MSSRKDRRKKGRAGKDQGSLSEDVDKLKLSESDDLNSSCCSSATNATTPGDTSSDATSGADFSDQNIPSKPKKSADDVKEDFPRWGKPSAELKQWTKRQVLTNHYKIDLSQAKIQCVVQYDLALTTFGKKQEVKECPKKFRRPAFNKIRAACWPDRYPAYDGNKIFYCSQYLDPENEAREWDGRVSLVDANQREIEIMYHVKKTEGGFLRVKDLIANYATIGKNFKSKNYPQAALQALDIIMRSTGMENTNLLKIGHCFFSPTFADQRAANAKFNLGRGAERWEGLFQTVSLGDAVAMGKNATSQLPSIFLNVDVSNKAFHKPQPLVDLLTDAADHYDNSLDQFLNGAKIMYEITSKKDGSCHRELLQFARFDRHPQQTNAFDFEINGQKQNGNVVDYFLAKYGVNVGAHHHAYRCVRSAKNNLYPSTLCSVAPRNLQTAPCKYLTGEQTAKLCDLSASNPTEKKEKVDENLRSLRLNAGMCLQREFSIKVIEEMTVVTGQMLGHPIVQNSTKYDIDHLGKWSYRQNKFRESCNVQQKRWLVINLKSNNAELIRRLEDMMREAGVMDIPAIIDRISYIPPTIESMARWLEETCKVDRWQLIIVLLPDKIGSFDPYSEVKRTLELKLRRVNQCIKHKTIGKSTKTYKHILMKVNAKLNGVNHVCTSWPEDFWGAPGSCRTMIMGADVTHPPPGSDSLSFAAVTASYDNYFAKYNMQWRSQQATVEIIQAMEEMTKAHLDFYRSKNEGKYPNIIIVYRDGVGDSQFATVKASELQAIKNACAAKKIADVKITFIVVQKRNHTRFFDEVGSEGRRTMYGNVLPGFFVNSTITHPWHLDFFLVSQNCPKGTAVPARYRVLSNDVKLSDDKLLKMTFWLCHVFNRCAMCVSYPAPTYYAHLAAARVKIYHGASQQGAMAQVDTSLSSLDRNYPMYYV